jgi:Tfp pilus assembly PilM family ATPase
LVVARLQEGWQSLRAELFPSRVLLELSDLLLVGQRLPRGRQPLEEPWLVPVPAATLSQGRPRETEALGDFIGDLMLSHGAINAHLTVVLPAAATQWRVLAWSPGEWTLDPVGRLRQLQPDLALGYGLEQAFLDVLPLEGDGGQTLVVAIERQLLQRWLEVFGIAGVLLNRIVPAQVALMAALQERLAEADPQELVALLLPEQKAVRLLVWRRGEPLYERLLAGTAEQAMAELQRCLTFLQQRQRQGPAAPVTLLLERELQPEQHQRLQQWLDQPLELLGTEGYGSLALQGLAKLEALR